MLAKNWHHIQWYRTGHQWYIVHLDTMFWGVGWLVLVLAGTGHTVDVFVSSTGDDSATGATEATAWQTFSRLANATIASGDTVHLVAGSRWDTPLVLHGGGAGCVGTMRGFIEHLTLSPTEGAVAGWVVDPGLPGNGSAPVAVQVELDGIKGEACSNPASVW